MRTQNVWFLKNNQSSQTEQLLYLLRKGRVLPFLSCKFWISKLFWFKLSPTPEYDFDRELACIALVAEGRWTCSELLTTSLRRLWEDLLAAVALCASIPHTSNFNLSTSSSLNTSSRSSLFTIIVSSQATTHPPPSSNGKRTRVTVTRVNVPSSAATIKFKCPAHTELNHLS